MLPIPCHRNQQQMAVMILVSKDNIVSAMLSWAFLRK